MLTFKELRQQSGLTQTEISKYFDIPYRTIQDWEHEKRKCPVYVLELMKYKLIKEGIITE